MLAESPLYQKWMAEKAREVTQSHIVRVLRTRLGEVPEVVAAQVRSIVDLEKLEEALDHASVCKSMADFRKRIAH
jgi:hypothetical protein